MSESGLDISLQGDVPDTDFDADVSNPMGDVTTLSEFQHQQKPGRGSSGASTKGRSSLTTPSRKHSTITADNSLELSGTKSKTATGNRSDRRVSFGQNAELTDLSPIAGTFSEAGTVSSKRTKDTSRNNSNNTTFDVSVDEGSVSNTSRNTSKDTTSKNNSRNTSVNVSRNSNTTAASIRSSAGKSSVAANSSVEEQPSLDDNNDDDNNNSGGDFDDGFGGGGDDYPEEEPEDEGSEQEPSEIDRYQSQADTPLTNKSMNRSGISSIGSSSSSTGRGSFRESIGSERRTPNTSRATRTPGTDASGVSGSSRISLGTTPGSHEFYRGRAVADDSFHIAGGGEGSDEDEEGEGEGREQSTDEEADTSAVITPISGRKRGHKHTQAVRGSDDEDADASTFSEGQSFVNNSFLHTIHSSNKKYVDGRKKLQDAIKPARLKQQQKKGGRGAKKLYSSDEEEEGGEQLHGTMH